MDHLVPGQPSLVNPILYGWEDLGLNEFITQAKDSLTKVQSLRHLLTIMGPQGK